MTRLAEIQTHVASMGELLNVVGAMRSLASMRLQEAHRALPSARRYSQSMANAVGAALALVPEAATAGQVPQGHRALVLCTAEHGFVGGFNDRLLDVAEKELSARDVLFILGSRGIALAQERGRVMAWTHPMATRLQSVPEISQRLAAELYRSIARGEITCAEVVFAPYRQGSAAAIDRRRVFPLDLATRAAVPARLPPLHNLPLTVLLEKLIAEYVFALLTEAATESLASENAARFNAMQSAQENVSKKLDQLRQEGYLARQEEITTELLDLVTGAEALQGGSGLR